MPITYRCAECAETYEVDNDLTGRTIRCRQCDALNRVPFLPAPKQTSPPTAAPIQEPHAASSLTFTKGLLLGALLMGLASGVGLWLGLTPRKSEPPSQASSPPATRSQPLPASAPAAGPIPVVHQPSTDEMVIAQREAIEAEERRQAELQEQLAQQQAKERAAQEEQRRQAELQAKRLKLEREKAEEEEYQRQVQIELGLMSKGEQQTVLSIARKLQAKQSINFSEFTFMRRHWIVFERSVEALHSIRGLADTLGFTEFCKCLMIDLKVEKKAALFASDWMADLGKPLKCFTARAVAREIQRLGGVEKLPSGYKQFIQEHQTAFAPILR
jgi:hypothetical protein